MAVQSLRQSPRQWLIFMGLALIFGSVAGLVVNKVNSPLFVLVGLIGLISFVGAITAVEFGLLFLIFITYTRFSDIAVHYYGAPSVAKSFVVLLIVAILIRWAIFHERPENWQVPLVLIGVYGLVGFASILYAPQPVVVWDALLDYVKDAVIAIVVVVLLKRAPNFRHVIWTLLLAGILMGTITVYQYYTKTFTSDYGGFGQAEVMQIVGATNDYRISGVIGDPNFYAQIMVVLVPLALERFLHEKRILLRLVAGWALIVTALSVVFTFSRGGFLALAVVLFLFLLLYPPKPNRMPLFLLAVIIVMSLVPISYYDRILSINQLFTASDVGFRTNDLAIRGRASETLTAIEMFKDHPILGVGLKNFPYLYMEYSKSIGLAPSSSQRSPHNLYLETAAETGTVGLFAFAIMIIVTFVTVKSARDRFRRAEMYDYADMVTGFGVALIGYLVAAIFIHAAFPRFFYLLIGIGLALDAIAKNEIAEQRGRSSSLAKARE